LIERLNLLLLEVTLKAFWDATREESVLVRLNRPNKEMIFHNEPLIATTIATKKIRGIRCEANINAVT